MSKHKVKITGLNNFITDVRKCKSKEEEIRRINKELANIRTKFAGNNLLEGYQKKKYVSKLIFIFLLGHNLDFGHIEAINLMGSEKHSEKCMGYLFASIFLNEKSKLIRLVVRTVETDLMSNIPNNQNLALKYIANMPNKIITDTLGDQILLLLFRSDTQDAVKQSALLSLLAVYKIKPEVIPEMDYQKRIACFLSEQNLGVVTAAASLVEELIKDKKIKQEVVMSTAICKLNRLLRTQCLDISEYNFYHACAPWLSMKLMRLLRHCDFPSDSILQTRLFECIDTILSKILDPTKSKKTEHRNTKYILLLEAVQVIHSMKLHQNHCYRVCSSLDLCLKQKDSNLRYLALECMKILSEEDTTNKRIQRNLSSITKILSIEKDESIRDKAADLLCKICNDYNYKEIVTELFGYFENGTLAEKEKTVFKIYIIAEKHHDDRKWFVDTVIDLVYAGGEFVKKEIWYRFIQFIINNSSMQGYSAKRAFEVVQSSNCNENVVVLSAYILGEFGNLIAGDNRSSPIIQLNLLHSKFYFSECETKALLLTTYVKFANLFPEIKENIKNIFRNNSNSPITEIQQRAVEYLKLLEVASIDYLATVLEEMPRFKKQKPIIEIALSKFKHEDTRLPPEKKSQLVNAADTRPQTTSYNALYDESVDVPKRMVSLLPKTPAVSNVDILADVFSNTNIFDPIPIQRSISTVFHSVKREELVNFIWNKSGTLFESNTLKVQYDSQFTRQEGQIRFKYHNKTSYPFSSFLPHFPFENNLHKWSFVVHPCSTTINPISDVEQRINVECLQTFTHMPSLSVTFVTMGSQQTVPIQIPMTLNKFIEPAPMSCEEFESRWNNEALRFHQATKSFSMKRVYDGKNMIEKKLNGFGVAILRSNDPHHKNVVCSGVFYCRSNVVGILFVLQPQYELSTYNLKVRSANKEVSEEVLRLVELII